MSFVLFGGVVPKAQAHYRPAYQYYPYWYPPGWYGYHPVWGPSYYYGRWVASDGGYLYLTGLANVINAQGGFLVNREQAVLLRQYAHTVSLDNRSRAFDQWLHEYQHAPTREDLRERIQHEKLRRALNNPPREEVYAGTSLNDLLVALQRLQASGIQGEPIPLDGRLLHQINVTTGRTIGKIDFLKEGLRWPHLLRRAPFQSEAAQLDALLGQAVGQVVSQGQVVPETQEMITRIIESLDGQLDSLVASEQRQPTCTPSEWCQAKRSLRQCREAVLGLHQPEARDHLIGVYRAQGRTVAELVRHMTATGLRFAPVGEGNEAAYTALHQALMAYYVSANPTGSWAGTRY
jgi:hypothetical protein